MKYKILIILLLVVNNLVFGQKLIPRDTLIYDYNYLVKAIEDTHPDPYSSFGNKIKFHYKAQLLKENIPQEGLSKFHFSNLIISFLSQLNDGHTTIYSPEKVIDDTLNFTLPVELKVAFDCIFVSDAIENYKNLVGCKILSIENINIDSLIKTVRILKPSENIYGTYLNMTKIIASKRTVMQLFPRLQNQLSILVQFANEKTENVKIVYYTENQLNQKSWTNSNYSNISPNKKLIDSKFIDQQNKIAYIGWYHAFNSRESVESSKRSNYYLDMNLNAVYKTLNQPRPKDNEEAIQMLPSLYETVAGVLNKMKENNSTHLIIDLRNNRGGWTSLAMPVLYMLFGDNFFEFNSKTEYNTLISKLYLRKNNQTLDQFNQNNHTNFSLGDYRFSGFFVQDTTINILQRRNNFINDQRRFGFSSFGWYEKLNGKPIYSPKLIVLTSPETFSAAFHFTWFLTEIGNAKIVGVPSSQAGNTYMEGTPFELPKTHLKGSISNSQQIFYPNNMEKGTILKPDFPMNWELFNKYSFDNNAEIMYILDLIKENKI